MPIYTNDPCDDGLFPVEPSLRSSIGIGPKVTKAIDAATKDWLDNHPEATTTVEDNSLTNAKFMDGSVNSRVIENESITTDDIADLAVTTPKIANLTVTTLKIADNAVDASKIASSAADGLRTMSTTQLGVAKVGAGLAMNNGAIELNGGDIAPAVTAWLNAHPEATTTVQDGSITNAKLVQSGGILSDVNSLLPDVQKLKDAITYELVQGNVYNPFEENNEINRLRTPTPLFMHGHVTVTAADGTQVTGAVYDDSFTKVHGFSWGSGFSFNAVANYRYLHVIVRKPDNSALVPNEQYKPLIEISDLGTDVILNNLVAQNRLLSLGTLQGTTNGNYFSSIYYICKAGDSLSCSKLSNASGRKILSVYDKDMALIGSIDAVGTTTVVPFDYEFPDGATYFKIDCIVSQVKHWAAGDLKYTIASDLMDKGLSDIEREISALKNWYEVVRIDNTNCAQASFNPSQPSEWYASDLVAIELDCSDYCRFEVLSKNRATSWQVAWNGGQIPRGGRDYSYPAFDDTVFLRVYSSTGGAITVDEVIDDLVIIGYFKGRQSDSTVSISNAKAINWESMVTEGTSTGILTNGSYTLERNETGNMYVTGFLPCVAGDSIEIGGHLATTWVAWATFDGDGRYVTHTVGNGTNDPATISHTFTDDERYFVAAMAANGGRMRYVSKYVGRHETMPTSYANETDAVVSRIESIVTGIFESVPLVFGFATDQHYNPRVLGGDYVKHGALALSEVSRRQPLDEIILGGDIASYSSYTIADILDDCSEYLSYFANASCPVVSIAGNHDAFQNNGNMTPYQMYNAHFKRLAQSKALDAYQVMGTNGYIDHLPQKVRTIIIDTNPHGNMTDAMLSQWLQDAFDTMPEGWTAIICGHQPALMSLPTPPFYNQIATYNSVLITNKEKIDFIIFGHSHRDGVYVSDEGITVVNVTSGLYEGRYDGKPYSPKETAFDVFVYDKPNSTVRTVRFGYGYDRTIKLNGSVKTITYDLTSGSTLNNTEMHVHAGSSFDDMLTGVTGAITITMGGVDITADAYSNGRISIENVTDNVVITEAE